MIGDSTTSAGSDSEITPAGIAPAALTPTGGNGLVVADGLAVALP
jgi:hypothetical protein